MTKYKLNVNGYCMEGNAHTLTPEEVQKVQDFQKENFHDKLSEMYPYFPDILDDFEHGLPNWWMASRPYVNDRLTFTLRDENDQVVWECKWDELEDPYTLDEKYGLPSNFEELIEVLDAYPHEGHENILCIIEDVKGSICTYIIESDEQPQPKDFGFMAHSLESPVFGYEFMDKMFYKGQELEKDYDDEWLTGKSLDIYLFTLEDVNNGVYDSDEEE